jgi:hypothetical protein
LDSNDQLFTTFYRASRKKTLERKTGSGRKSALSGSKVRAKLKAETQGRSAKSFRSLGRKYKVHHATVKKCLEQMGVHRRVKQSAPKQTEKQKTIKQRLRRLSQTIFAASSTYKCVMDDESYFTVTSGKPNIISSLPSILRQKK